MAQTFIGNKAIIRLFRALYRPSSVSGTKPMANKSKLQISGDLPAMETLKYYTSQDTYGIMPPDYIFLRHMTSVISGPKVFLTSIAPLLVTFATKWYLHSETYISYKFHALYHQKGIFVCAQKTSCTCQRRFFRSSHGVGRSGTADRKSSIAGLFVCEGLLQASFA